jgi:hypothetical protein
MKIALVLVLVIHGLVVAAQSPAAFRASSGVANPTWLAWWPIGLGESWLSASLHLGKPPFTWLLGLGWLAGGLLLCASGLALAGILVAPEHWRFLATLGAALSLAMLLLYLHPFYLVGLALSVAILAELRWVHWIPAGILGA